MSVRGFFSTLGTALIAVVMLCGGALVAWRLFGQARYRGECEHSVGCRSFYCIHHDLEHKQQVPAPHGMCTKSCDSDVDCEAGAACVALGDEARDDLPPLRKLDRACLVVVDAR
jgi:hypothetical protein